MDLFEKVGGSQALILHKNLTNQYGFDSIEVEVHVALILHKNLTNLLKSSLNQECIMVGVNPS